MTTSVEDTGRGAAETRIRFPADYILASSTDKRGVITYANPAFCEISGFALEELVGAPHRLVRHPEMPRGLFHLFWERLQKGLPVGAFVKNRAKDGRAYIVFALAAPFHDGFLSVRIQPRSSYLRPVLEIYQQLLERETNGLDPRQSNAALQHEIGQLGYADYDEFMLAVFSDELKLRMQAAKQELPARLTALDTLSQRVTEIRKSAMELGRGFHNIRGEPANIRILSNRLEQGGRSISTIAQNYDLMAKEMKDHIEQLCCNENGTLTDLHSATSLGRFALLASHLLLELSAQSEGKKGEAEWVDEELNRIRLHSTLLEQNALSQLRSIVRACNQIPDLSRQLRRRINGLDVVKLLCRVENCRLNDQDTGLAGVIARLDGFHKEAEDILSSLARNSLQTSQIAQTLL